MRSSGQGQWSCRTTSVASVARQGRLGFREVVWDPSQRSAQITWAKHRRRLPPAMAKLVRAVCRCRTQSYGISMQTSGMERNNKPTVTTESRSIPWWIAKLVTRLTILHREQNNGFTIFFPSTLSQFVPSHLLYKAPFESPILAARSISPRGRLSRPRDIYMSITAFHCSWYSRQSRLLSLRPCGLYWHRPILIKEIDPRR